MTLLRDIRFAAYIDLQYTEGKEDARTAVPTAYHRCSGLYPREFKFLPGLSTHQLIIQQQ